jgi:uncharacterized protein (TIGR03435 family)
MKKLTLGIIALAALPGGALQAQNITGTWQGTLKAGPQELRGVLKIALEDDKYKGTLYSIDQGGQPIPTSSFTRDGPVVKFAITAISGTYEGRLSADGNTIAGTWTQFGMPAPLTLVRATPETAWTIPDPPPPPKTMAKDANPTFEVATIKPSKPEESFSMLVGRRGAPANSLTTTGTSLSDLIKFAYGLHSRQIIGAPAWFESEKYDVVGKPDVEGTPSVDQVKTMMQKLLADRFQLAFHHEKKELSVYAITVANTGIKMTKDENNPNGLPGIQGGGVRGMNVRNATMAEFAEFANLMQAITLDKPVVDQTGLGSARWDFILKWTPDSSQSGFVRAGQNDPPSADSADAPPDLFTAFQQQLGLKLVSTKAPVDVLVIDKVEKPSAN